MMNVCLLSMFSSAEGYLLRYFEQIVLLRSLLNNFGDSLHCIWVEGDSTDNTWAELQRLQAKFEIDAQLWQHHHGQDLHRGTGHPQRLANLSRIWNEMLDAVPRDADIAVIVESDLTWTLEVMDGLIDRAEKDGQIHCPMVWLGTVFYDTFMYRRGGKRFTNRRPYHPDLTIGEPLELESAGSCLVMPAEIARVHRTTPEGELMGFCHSARSAGYKVILDSGLSIQQPESEWVGSQSFAGAF